MKRILVAPLNWGLGHATRCIPIITSLEAHGFEPIIASDGQALALLKMEFPHLTHVELPSYNITYADKGEKFKLKLIKDSPHLIKTIKKEKKATKNIISKYNIDGIISDNRFGVRHKRIPSVFITHQLRVLSGTTTWLSTALHKQIIEKFNECWIPDQKDNPNLSGKLGHVDNMGLPLCYLGPLSRFTKSNQIKRYKLMVLLSGPEPQRTMLEEQLLNELENYKGPCLFVKGKIESAQTKEEYNNLTIYNFLTSKDLEEALNSSELILSRSGYTTVMDLAKLGNKAFFIPTPGQFEQEYLAQKLMEDGIAPFATQDSFHLSLLKEIEKFKGFNELNYLVDYATLFSLFKRK
ncbi:glycosyltransferase [Winogradskyella aurantiaca]|uniref:glycosyltransferase n=1 Tax=Winogradskyella aurantiaca TaxID=2219558 RepID=UPI000E1D0251|nr:glycosyltransferase [Winogradskyella aurantiaca]